VPGHQAALAALAARDPALGDDLDPAALPALAAYLDLLARWADRTSLTGARTPGERVDLLVGAVLPALACLEGPDLIDVGSGNGSPGLVLALLRPGLRVTLLEPRQKRWAFLRDAARAAGRPDVAVVRGRHHEYPGPPAATVTLRALRLPPAELAPLVRPGGLLLVFGRLEGERGPFAELAAPAAGLHRLRRG
jgi:16S rRNA (guanine(527)-N(7))-methyltransferase RsmG